MAASTASSSSGQLRITVEGEPRGVGLCHCLACLPWVQLPPGAAAFDKDPD